MREETALVIISVTFFLTVAGVILLRPIAKRLGEFLEVLIHEKRGQQSPLRSSPVVLADSARLEERLELLEERVEFTERMLTSRRPGDALPGAERPPAEGS